MSEQSTITTAGPELDAEIAEKIMGVAGVEIVRGVAQHRVHRGYIPVGGYSQDFSAAKRLQAKLVADGWSCTIIETQNDGVDATFIKAQPDSDEDLIGDAVAPTEQLALCLAALKTIPK